MPQIESEDQQGENDNKMIETQSLENKPDEQQQEKPTPRTFTQKLPLEGLQALQLEMEPVNNQASRAFHRFKLRMKQRLQPHLEKRSTIIQGIPGFWAKTVEDFRHPSDGCKIMLYFEKNRYFWNDVVVKEYLAGITGLKPSLSTPIQWCQDYEHKSFGHRHHNCSPNFFNWFYDHNFAGSTRIAEVIIKELWPNPLQYYLKKRAPK